MNYEQIKCHENLTLPRRFTERMKAMLGEGFPAFCASYGKPPHPSLRVNTLKLTAEELQSIAPFAEKAVPWQENGFYYSADGDIRPGKHPLHEAGAYYIQEASAMLPGSLCPPKPGERVLDLCAAPGGKATQLAAALDSEGLLVANEIHPGRAAILSRNLERMGVRNCVVTNATPAELSAKFPAFFDKIVVDAPCSGEGMFRKEADAVTMWSPENVALCATRQAEILEEAAKMLAAAVQETLNLCINTHGAKEAKAIGSGVYLMKNIHAPGILVECGFLSNQEETAALQTPEHQRKLTCAIAAGLLRGMAGEGDV